MFPFSQQINDVGIFEVWRGFWYVITRRSTTDSSVNARRKNITSKTWLTALRYKKNWKKFYRVFRFLHKTFRQKCHHLSPKLFVCGSERMDKRLKLEAVPQISQFYWWKSFFITLNSFILPINNPVLRNPSFVNAFTRDRHWILSWEIHAPRRFFKTRSSNILPLIPRFSTYHLSFRHSKQKFLQQPLLRIYNYNPQPYNYLPSI